MSRALTQISVLKNNAEYASTALTLSEATKSILVRYHASKSLRSLSSDQQLRSYVESRLQLLSVQLRKNAEEVRVDPLSVYLLCYELDVPTQVS